MSPLAPILASILSLLLITHLCTAAQLSKLFVVFRHGIRTPVIPLPFKDAQTWDNHFPMQISSSNHRQDQLFFVVPAPNEGILLGNSFSGQLSDSGVKQHVELGKSLSEKYSRQLGFSSSALPSDMIHTETTWKPRTIGSLLAHLSGWFRDGTPVEPPSISSSEISDLYANWYESPLQCPKVVDMYNEMRSRDEFKNYMAQHEDFRRALANKVNVPLEKVDFFFFHDTLACYVAEGFKLPGNLTMDEYERIEEIVTWEYNYYFSNKEFTRLNIGNMLGRIQKFMAQNDTTGESSKRLFMFSTHDMGVHPLLAAHSYLPKEWTWFASNIVFELYDNSTVRIFYNQDTQIPIPGCGFNHCPLDVYFASTEWAVPNDWRNECAVNDLHDFFSVQFTAYDAMRARAT